MINELLSTARSPPRTAGPITMATAAPNDAADESPSVNGLTSGFLSSPCITAPATARLIPVRIARKIRGSRKLTTISSACGFDGAGTVNGIASYQLPTVGMYVCRKFWIETAHAWATASTVSSGVMETVPIPAERIAAATTTSRRAAIRKIRRRLPALYRVLTEGCGAEPGGQDGSDKGFLFL